MNLRASVIIPNLDCPLVGDTVQALTSQTLDGGALEILGRKSALPLVRTMHQIGG